LDFGHTKSIRMSDSKRVENAGRREALKKIALGGIGAGAASQFPIVGQSASSVCPAHSQPGQAAPPLPLSDTNWKPRFFDEHQNKTVVVLTELIIPETDTPGAKGALVNRFMDLLLSDQDADKQKPFLEGLAWIDGRSLELHGKPFVALSVEQQTAMLTPLADPANSTPEDQPGARFFQDLKDATIYAYYTSQAGMERELEYAGGEYHSEFPGACNHPEHQT
jgi:hypothetical protein